MHEGGAILIQERERLRQGRRFATLADVINHYNRFLSLGLTATERAELEQYLKSL